MKNYYAKHKGKCYTFQDRQLRDYSVHIKAFEPLTRSEAMRQFGYTDSCSIRVIKCTLLSSEEALSNVDAEESK